VAVTVFHHGPAVTVKLIVGYLDGFGSGVNSTPIHVVDVVDIDVEKCWKVFTFPASRDHHRRVPDDEFRRSVGEYLAPGAKRRLQERRTPLDVVDDDPRDYRPLRSGVHEAHSGVSDPAVPLEPI